MNNKNSSKDIFGAYCGSLFCRDFSEIEDFHGYLLWDIEDDSVEEVEIENDYGFSLVPVNQFTDFDNLDIELDNPTKNNKIKIVWNGYSSQRNTENVEKLKTYLKSKYNIIEFKEKKNFLNETTIEVTNSNDIKIENISKKEGQQKLFVEYLESLGYEQDFINEVIDLDNEISNKIKDEYQEPVIWKPLILRAENFKSFENIHIDFRDLSGVTQITGNNQVGKTTAYSLISYIAYNATLETEKVQKNGDNRFINNKLNKDYCWGEMVFEADGNYYGLKRISTRKWNRDKSEISGVSTILNYYKLSNPDESFSDTNIVDNLNDQVKKKTQKVVDNIINNYSNFKKLALTTSDTLNEILKVDKAEFIDSLLFNLGMDFFDIKLKEIKEHSKIYFNNHPKINLTVDSVNNKITLIEDKIKNNKDIILECKNDITSFKNERDSLFENKNQEQKKINKIDSEILKLNLSELNKNILLNNNNLTEKRELYKNNNQKIKQLVDKFDDSLLKSLNEKYTERKEQILSKKDEINQIKIDISDVESKINKENTNIFYIKKEIDIVNKEILLLEESKTCPTCNQLLKEDSLNNIKQKIEEKSNSLNEKTKSITSFEKQIKKHTKEKDNLLNNIEKIKKDIENININNETLLLEIAEQENKRNSFNLRSELTLKNENIRMEGENLKLIIENLTDKIKLYENNQKYILENIEIQTIIDEYNLKINKISSDIVSLEKKITELEINNNYLHEQKDNELKQLKKFQKQQQKEKLFSVYENCVHRNGIPTLMLKKYSLPLINKMLNELLKEVPFDVYLDEETLRLKMVDISNTKSSIDCISGSGKERTFASIALKYCLNELNIKSKPEILILDEVTGKLVGKSIDEFVDVLSLLKTKISNILIIEHVHNLKPDHVIKIEKDEKGISKITNII